MKTENSFSFLSLSLICSICLGLLRWPCGKESTRQVQETQCQSLGWEHPLEQEIATHYWVARLPVVLPGEFCE